MAYYLKLLLNMALPLVQRLHLPSHRRLLCAAAIDEAHFRRGSECHY